jgi:hypothetical protein
MEQPECTEGKWWQPAALYLRYTLHLVASSIHEHTEDNFRGLQTRAEPYQKVTALITCQPTPTCVTGFVKC